MTHLESTLDRIDPVRLLSATWWVVFPAFSTVLVLYVYDAMYFRTGEPMQWLAGRTRVSLLVASSYTAAYAWLVVAYVTTVVADHDVLPSWAGSQTALGPAFWKAIVLIIVVATLYAPHQIWRALAR